MKVDIQPISGKAQYSLNLSRWALLTVLFLVFITVPVIWGDSGIATVIELTDSDRATLDTLLGPGVVGNAVPAPVIENPQDFLPFRVCDWNFRVASGKAKGKMRPHSLRPLKRDEPVGAWRLSPGSHHVVYLRRSKDGSISVISEQDADQGMIVRFSPHVPILLPGFKPGETRDFKIDVKVYDVTHPDHLKHGGHIKLKISYLGAFEVNVPAGKQEAILIKWEDKGKVGPAVVEDIHYRFFVKDSGLVAQIDKKNISAFLIYNEHLKEGEVLIDVCVQ